MQNYNENEFEAFRMRIIVSVSCLLIIVGFFFQYMGFLEIVESKTMGGAVVTIAGVFAVGIGLLMLVLTRDKR